MATDTMLCWLTSRKKACVGFSCRRRLGARGGAVTQRKRRALAAAGSYLMILTSSLMFTWSGTRNLVLSRTGSCFSPLYLSMITCRQEVMR